MRNEVDVLDLVIEVDLWVIGMTMSRFLMLRIANLALGKFVSAHSHGSLLTALEGGHFSVPTDLEHVKVGGGVVIRHFVRAEIVVSAFEFWKLVDTAAPFGRLFVVNDTAHTSDSTKWLSPFISALHLIGKL